MKRALALLFAVAIVAVHPAVAGPINVPIYIEDNHAGSFYWLAEHLDLEEPCTLLHFDAHSDASAIFDSDVIRRRLRRVASAAERRTWLESWRRDGAVQCFNWIEPLLPAPIAEVIWVPADRADGANARTAEAGQLIDGHSEAAPRASGRFSSRYRVAGLEQLRGELRDDRPVIATIDLDYFAGVAADERAASFERVWSFVAGVRNLRAVTIAISRPYLSGDQEADALVQLALRASLSLPTAVIQFEPFRTVGNDRSAKAAEYRARHEDVPRFDVEKSSPQLRALLLANATRVGVRENRARWNTLLATWAAAAPTFRAVVKDHQPSTDGVWRLPASERAEISLQAVPWYTTIDRVQWAVELPVFARCNLTAGPADETPFAHDAAPRPRWREVPLPTNEQKLPIEQLRQFFDATSGCGAIRLKAKVFAGGTERETPTIEIRRSLGSGFRAALTEQFGLPYLFGSGSLREGEKTGPETGWGADCANFLINGLRRQGAGIPWSNPKQFRRHLEVVRSDATLADNHAVAPDDLEAGLIVHLGRHVGAVMEDRAPIGLLDGSDIVAHQLEGTPEFIPVGALLRARGVTRFDLLRAPRIDDRGDLLIGGDVMLGRTIGHAIAKGIDPFAGVRELLSRSDQKLINLESVITDKGAPAAAKKFHLRARRSAARSLIDAGFHTISLANNHAGDFGEEALLDSIAHLQNRGASIIGAARTPADAYAAKILTIRNHRVALLAVSDCPGEFAKTRGSATIANTSDQQRLSEAIADARHAADFIVMLVHWGDENTPIVTDRQRALARWLIDRGVDLIAGSHPHCVQPLDFYRGRPIAYSLGNLVFDGAPTVASWNRGALLSVTFDERNKSPAVRLLPINLDERGFPSVRAAPPGVAGSP